MYRRADILEAGRRGDTVASVFLSKELLFLMLRVLIEFGCLGQLDIGRDLLGLYCLLQDVFDDEGQILIWNHLAPPVENPPPLSLDEHHRCQELQF